MYQEGDPAYDFCVVLSGAVEILVKSDGQECVIASHTPGRFLCDGQLAKGIIGISRQGRVMA